MNLLKLFWRHSSAPVARERLQILLAHKRVSLNPTALLGTLRDEILAVIAKHVAFDPARAAPDLSESGRIPESALR